MKENSAEAKTEFKNEPTGFSNENNWPNAVRLKMIEKSKFYTGDERVYQYGFYDGYQLQITHLQSKVAELEAERDKLREALLEILAYADLPPTAPFDPFEIATNALK